MENIIIIGGGGNAKVLISIINKIGKYNILGYTDKKNNGKILGCKYLGLDKEILNYKNIAMNAVIGVGKVDLDDIRLKLQKNFQKDGFNFPAIVSPNAIVNDEVNIENGTIIYDSVIINSGTIIGEACIINSGAIIEHDCKIGDNVSVAPGAIINGGSTIGNNTFVGSGSIINQGITIINNCLIGAGAVVISDIKESGVYIGIPARKIK